MKRIAALVIVVFACGIAALAQTSEKPPVFKNVTLEFQDGSRHREVGGVLRYEREAIVFKAYGLLQDKHSRTIRYDEIASAQFMASEAPNGVAAAVLPLAAIATGHRKYLTITTKDGHYTILQLSPATHLIALIELERRAHITIAR